jgi:hypothetical protein
MVTLPGPVRDLRQTLDSEGRLWLTWLAPEFNMAQRPVRTLGGFEIWGVDYAREEYCSGCPVKTRKIAKLGIQPPPPGLTVNPGPYEWQTRLRPDRVYVFKVAGFSDRDAVHPQSWTEIEVWTAQAPGPLAGFAVQADDLSVRFGWSASAAELEDRGLAVEVQRREAPDGTWTALDLRQGRLDLDVAYGRAYRYRARLVRTLGPSRTPGPWSAELSAAVVDQLPPPPPGHLDAALAADGSVRLKWESRIDDPDVAGWKLYRRVGETGPFAPLNGLLTVNVHVDRSPPAGEELAYQVTALDAEGNESSPSAAARVYAVVEPLVEEPERPQFEDPGL